MIEFDGISFNEMISRQIMTELGGHDPSYTELAQDQVPNRVTRYSFMGAIAKINGLPFFPKIAEFCDGDLHSACDATVMTRGFFAPLCMVGQDKLIVAIANPWSPLAEEYLAPRFPHLELVKVVTLASEINRAIESVATNSGPSKSDLEAIDVEDNDDGIHDFDVTTDYTEPMAQLVATIMSDAVRTRASDIHFKVEKESFYYCFRVDGDLGTKVEIPMKLKDRLDAYLLNLMKLPTEIRNTAPGISGRFTISYFHRPIDVRYERHRTYRGYHVTMRLLDKSNVPPEGRHIVIHANNLANLLSETAVTSSDFNSVKALVQGELNTFLGFTFHVLGDRSEGGLPIDGSSDRKVFALHQQAVGYG